MRHHKRIDMKYKVISVVFVAVMLIVLFSAAAHITDRAVRPVAKFQAQHFAEMYTNRIIEKAAAEYLEKNKFTYSDFAAVLHDSSGKAVSVEAMSYNINKVQSELALAINKKLSESETFSDSIPLGSLTNSYLLAGKGPRLKLRICPAGTASVRLKSDFSSAGINQTRHCISVVITADVTSALPIYSFKSKVKFEFLLAENILIGNVPDLSRYCSPN